MSEFQVEVVTKFIPDGPDGSGWYAWEKEYPEEGYFLVSLEKPTDSELKQVCSDYVLVE